MREISLGKSYKRMGRQFGETERDLGTFLSRDQDRIDWDARNAIRIFFSKILSGYLDQLTSFQESLSESLSGVSRKAYLRKFCSITDTVLDEANKVDKIIINKKLRRELHQLFRSKIRSWYAVNPLMKRCLDKPHGYPGDYETLEMFYIYEPTESVGLNGFFDRYILNHAACVRTRKERMKMLLKQRLFSCVTASISSMSILSLGSGSCREWIEICEEDDKQWLGKLEVRLTCLDRDLGALDLARKNLSQNPVLTSVQIRHEDLFAFSRQRQVITEEADQFDLIYATGIADYFYDECLSDIVQTAFGLLKPKGELVITHKDRTQFSVVVSEWLCDWSFVPRSRQEFVSVVIGSLREDVGLKPSYQVDYDESGKVVFLTIRKT